MNNMHLDTLVDKLSSYSIESWTAVNDVLQMMAENISIHEYPDLHQLADLSLYFTTNIDLRLPHRGEAVVGAGEVFFTWASSETDSAHTVIIRGNYDDGSMTFHVINLLVRLAKMIKDQHEVDDMRRVMARILSSELADIHKAHNTAVRRMQQIFEERIK